MEVKETVNVILIPESSLPIQIVTLPLMRTADFALLNRGAHHAERHLKTVPDIRDSKWVGSLRLAGKYRALVDLGNMDPEQSFKERYRQRGPYFMYKISETARKVYAGGLNRHFEPEEGFEDIYWNTFIFKIKEPLLKDEGGVVEYEDLDEESITSAFNGKGISAKESLRWLSKQ